MFYPQQRVCVECCYVSSLWLNVMISSASVLWCVYNLYILSSSLNKAYYLLFILIDMCLDRKSPEEWFMIFCPSFPIIGRLFPLVLVGHWAFQSQFLPTTPPPMFNPSSIQKCTFVHLSGENLEIIRLAFTKNKSTLVIKQCLFLYDSLGPILQSADLIIYCV